MCVRGGEGGGGGGQGGQMSGCLHGMNTRAPIFFYTQHVVTISSTELYSLMKIFLMVFIKEGIVAVTIKGR